MKKQNSKWIKPLLVWGIVVSAVALLQYMKGFPIWHGLSDGFFTGAVFFLGIGGFRLASNAGCFDLISYSVSHTFRLHHPKDEKREDFFTYRERRRQTPYETGMLICIGAVSLGLSILLVAVGRSI